MPLPPLPKGRSARRIPGAASPTFLTLLAALLLLTPAASLHAREKTTDYRFGDKIFSEGSPEHAALSAASPYLENEKFVMRQDYWKRDLLPGVGKALRLQFFKGHTYRFFFAAHPDKLGGEALVQMKILGPDSTVIATAIPEPPSSVAAAQLTPEATGLYLVLLLVEISGNAEEKEKAKTKEIPCVLFYGYE